jgi:hypothetical protein
MGIIKLPMASIFENRITPPNNIPPLNEGGLNIFISNIINLVAVVGGLYAFINLIIGGFQYISSGGDSKTTVAAWSRIYMSLIGLIIIISSFAVAAVIGQVFFGSWDAILNPQFTGPGANP